MLPSIYCVQSKAFAFFSFTKYSTRVREPLIKFIGTRHPQPKFDPSTTSSTATAALSHGGDNTATASVKPSFEFTNMPAKFRRKMISEEEIQIINSGGLRN